MRFWHLILQFTGVFLAAVKIQYWQELISLLTISCKGSRFYFYFLKIYFYLCYLFLAALDLRCCAQAFSSCGEQGLLFVVVHGLLISVASVAAEHRL